MSKNRQFWKVLVLAMLLMGCKPSNKKELAISEPEKNFLAKNEVPGYIKYQGGTIVLVNATIIDGTGNPIQKEGTIIVENGLFKSVGTASEIEIPEKSTLINLKGKTLVPGIVGMHNHLHVPGFPMVAEVAAMLYLASGVTTIQTCGAVSSQAEIDLSAQIANGEQIGPEIIPSAPFITGEGGNPNMIIPRNETHLRDTLQHWIKKGVKWFKVYRNTRPDDLKIIIDEAHENDAKVRGHLCATTFEEATKLGIDGIEHGLNSLSDFRTGKESGICNGGREYMDEMRIDGPEMRKLQQLMIDNKVFLTSTLSIYEASVPNRAYGDPRAIEVMSPHLKKQYEERRQILDGQSNDSTRNKRLKRIMEFEYQYQKMGGLLCSGVDAGRHVLPGFGDQRNFELLREAGFTAEEAVQIMTGNGATALERPDIGTIQEGKRADFIILDGNLEEDATVINKVETVFKMGIGYAPEYILNDLKGRFGLD
ncbi:Amidohydrolase family protein [Flagellimonas taeanensis]|uniref:Amidohydrolase family protein n=1 Tax=Flagellimonas taeanensis TaxID=1005926 RepID=A0A1M6RNT5_9FLAO|nr:amidohydrolase family protein [Allomuricauda taeanensis]SFB76130.1 Amidohydrolase family protein [Allomuricauda taeanensis]SHK33977.1 Amidohydrolase family protein [Allomuricauda taeanensis]